MKKITIIVFVLIMLMALPVFAENRTNPETLNMANTIEPIINDLIKEKCNNPNDKSVGHGGNLIYKREKILNHDGQSCSTKGNIGNVYYARCYEWWYDKNMKYCVKATKDIPLNVFSCIDESKVDIPYWDEQLQKAKIGVIYRYKITPHNPDLHPTLTLDKEGKK